MPEGERLGRGAAGQRHALHDPPSTRAGQLDELCLTVSPLLAGPGAGRITQGPPLPDASGVRPFTLAHLLGDESYLFCRYVRQ